MNALDSKRIWQGRIVNVRVDQIDGVRGLGRRTIEVVFSSQYFRRSSGRSPSASPVSGTWRISTSK